MIYDRLQLLAIQKMTVNYTGAFLAQNRSIFRQSASRKVGTNLIYIIIKRRRQVLPRRGANNRSNNNREAPAVSFRVIADHETDGKAEANRLHLLWQTAQRVYANTVDGTKDKPIVVVYLIKLF